MPVAVVCLFLAFQEINIKERKNFGLIFSRPEETLEGSGEDLTSHEGATSSGGGPPVGAQARGPLVAPLDLIPRL